MSHTLLQAAPVQTVPAGDCDLGYRAVGSGPDVVFVHGWPLFGLTWRHVVESLADRYRCHVFDLPGTGASTWSPSLRFRITDHARRVLAAIDHLGIDAFALVGHDSGAAISRYVAAEAGERVWANVIAGSELPGWHPPLLQALLASARLPGARTGFRTLLRIRLLRRSPLGFGAAFHDVDQSEGEFFDLFARPLIDSKPALTGQMGLARDWDWGATDALNDVHARITGPTLLLWGEHDPYFPATKAREMVPSFPAGASFESRADASLFVHEEHPAWFAERTAVLFERARAAGSTPAATAQG